MTTTTDRGWIRSLGSTGLQVSAVCAGGAPLGSMPDNFGRDLAYDDGVAMVRAILDSPVRWIDTSNGYSDGESERRIGAGIAQAGGLPGDFWVATKVDARGRDYSGDRVRASVAESKERLGLPFLPLVYLHDPEQHDFDELAAPGGAVQTLMALREEGEIGHVGLAGGDVRVMTRYLALGGFEVLLVHNRWTLVDHSAVELLAQAEELDVAVVNAAVYGGGILARPAGASDRYGYRPASPETLQAIAAMEATCREAGTDLRTAALRASVEDPRVDATVVGMSEPARLTQVATMLAADLPAGLLDELAQLLPAEHNWLDHPLHG